MAKRSIMGVISGKLGNMVGQKNSLVSNKDKQVWRVYQGTVANPKTVKQAHQRSLFVAAKNFQRAFEDILNHSWQGVDYGTKSLNHFRKLVLAGGGSDFPFFYQPKGAQNFIPQQWPISRGSLNINTVCHSEDSDAFIWDGAKQVSSSGQTITRGQLWEAFLQQNPMLQDGDMITVLAFKQTNSDIFPDGLNIPVYDRFIINVNDTSGSSVTPSIVSQNGMFTMVILGNPEFNVNFTVNDGLVTSFGVIISRQNGSKASWMRSKSNLYLISGVEYVYQTDEYATTCLDSFMNSTNAAESDWYLNQTGENEDEQQGGGGGDTPTQTITLESKEAALTPSGSVNAAYLTKGSLRGYIMYNGQYFTLRDTDLTATSFDEGKSISPSLTTIDLNAGLMEEIQAAGYHFYFPIEPDEP